MNTIWSGITITVLAKKYIKSIIKKNKNTQAIQINVKKSGCAGFKYSLSLIDNTKIKDNKKYYIYQKDKIKIYIPIKYMSILDKTEIDFIKTDGINRSIKFNNPNIQDFCGCGDSFNIKNINQLPT